MSTFDQVLITDTKHCDNIGKTRKLEKKSLEQTIRIDNKIWSYDQVLITDTKHCENIGKQPNLEKKSLEHTARIDNKIWSYDNRP